MKGYLLMVKILLFLFELGVGCGVLIFAYSQLIRPLFRGTSVFPMFRGRPSVERDIERVNGELEDKDLVRQLAEKQRQLGEKK